MHVLVGHFVSEASHITTRNTAFSSNNSVFIYTSICMFLMLMYEYK